MKYIITLHNKFKSPYHYQPINSQCIYTNTESYETDSADLCKQIIKDIMDVPVAELTLDEIKKDFSSPSYPDISESNLVAIQTYYNGRFGLYNTILRDLDAAIEEKISTTMKFDIPYEYNHFVIDTTVNNINEQQLDAYIEVRIYNEEFNT